MTHFLEGYIIALKNTWLVVITIIDERVGSCEDCINSTSLLTNGFLRRGSWRTIVCPRARDPLGRVHTLCTLAMVGQRLGA